jgi:5'-3' exonuclease
MSKTFQNIAELEPGTLMIVDALNLAFRYKHSRQLNFKDDYMKTVESLRKSYKAKYVIIACDQGSSSYRKELFPDYKGNREELRANQTAEEALEFKLFFEEFNATMQAYRDMEKFPLLRFPGVEADDIAGYIVKTVPDHFPIDNIWLISSDRDWDLLVALGVANRFSYVTRKEVTYDNWNTHYDCEPDQYISIKCLQGDSGDNVPGVDGLGPVRSAALVKQYGTTYDIIANLPLPGKAKYIQNLNQFGADALLLNYKLMDLVEFSEEAVGAENCEFIDQVLKDYIK